MQVVRLTSLDELAGLRDEWNELAGGVPFRSWEWLESWWRVYQQPASRQVSELFTLAVRDSPGRLAGLAPWYVQRSASQGRVVRFLGSGEVCSDYLTVLSRPECEEQVIDSLAHWMSEPTDLAAGQAAADRNSWDLLELSAVAADDHVIRGLAERLAARRHAIHRRPGPNCWRIALPPSWDEYLELLSKSRRKQMRRCERRAFDTGRAQLRRVTSEAELRQGLEILVSLHRRRRASLGDSGCFASPQFYAFHQDIALQLLERGSLELVWLELDGQPVAAEYQIVSKQTVYAYQSGIDPDVLEHEPGRLITLATLKQAIAEGRTVFDFLRGNEPYKAHWRADPRPTYDYFISPARGTARLRHRLFVASDHMKDWVKNTLSLRE
jgi:CelD/BcsL family acetyltransferase involved in cellulose biosynthesis